MDFSCVQLRVPAEEGGRKGGVKFVLLNLPQVLEFLWKEAVWMGWTGHVKDNLTMVGVHVRRGDTQANLIELEWCLLVFS